MTTTDHATTLVTWWVRVYTRHLPPAIAERRQAELVSDLWEQRAHAHQVGAPVLAVTLSILRRTAAGIPADPHWRHGQLAAARGRPHPQQGWRMTSTGTRALVRNWWLILAALLIPLQAVAAFGIMGLDTSTDPLWPKLWYTGALVMVIGAVLIAAGIVARRWARATGDVLIAIGVLPLTISLATVGSTPFVAVPLVTLLVISIAVLDAADARSLAAPANGARRWLLTAATVMAATLVGIGMARAGADPVAVVLVMVGAALIALLAVIGQRLRRIA
ncbi:MAG TPA: hypothetical protein VG276_21515 [Actinomycetes bacterium]|jgi:hypothetical protein|nr:hypothetical protein [Actinomycetes bacterium]